MPDAQLYPELLMYFSLISASLAVAELGREARPIDEVASHRPVSINYYMTSETSRTTYFCIDGTVSA